MTCLRKANFAMGGKLMEKEEEQEVTNLQTLSHQSIFID